MVLSILIIAGKVLAALIIGWTAGAILTHYARLFGIRKGLITGEWAEHLHAVVLLFWLPWWVCFVFSGIPGRIGAYLEESHEQALQEWKAVQEGRGNLPIPSQPEER